MAQQYSTYAQKTSWTPCETSPESNPWEQSMDCVLDRRQKGTINFRIKDGHLPNLNLTPKGLVRVHYTRHALDAIRLPSRGYGEVLSKFPLICRSRTNLHPYDLKKQWWRLGHLNDPFPIGSHPDNWNKFSDGPDNFYDPLDWEYDLFPLGTMAIRSYRTADNGPNGEVESALFTGEWSKKWYAVVVRLNYPRNVWATNAFGHYVKIKNYYEAITIYPTSWKEATADKENWKVLVNFS
jgi:hypothetical protein